MSIIFVILYWLMVIKEYTTRKKRYLRRSYVFIEHFMAFNINTTGKMHKIAHHHNTWLNSPHQPSLEKHAPPFCLRSLGPDSNACSLLWIKHATSRDVAQRIGDENCQQDHCTCNKLCDMRISCKKMTQFRVNIHRPFVSQGNHFDVALSSSCNTFRYICMCLLFLHWYSHDYPHGTECFL